MYVRTDRVTEDRQASLRLILVPSWRCVARRVPSQGTPGSTRKPEAAGQAPGGPNRPETSKNESKRNRSTQKIFRIRGGRAAELPPAHTRGLQLGGVTCGTLDRRSRAPDTLHYLLMACRVGGPNLVANSAGFEIYKSVLRKSTVLYPPCLLYTSPSPRD